MGLFKADSHATSIDIQCQFIWAGAQTYDKDALRLHYGLLKGKKTFYEYVYFCYLEPCVIYNKHNNYMLN